jgi:hypothetical protein
MLKETLSQTNATDYPLFALVLFILVFTLVSIRVLMRGKRDPRHLHLASLPLSDDGNPGTVNLSTKEDLR